MHIKLHHTESVAKDITSFWFEPEKPVEFVAGQFIEMFLPHNHPDERGQKHWFTLSSSPSEKLLSITTKHASKRSSTFKQELFKLNPSAFVTISEPMGDFVLPKDISIPLVFIAGGIGITPVRSIVKWLADTHERRNIQILYAAHRLEDIAFQELFEAYGSKFNILLSEATNEQKTLSGYLTGRHILNISGKNPNQLIYISGPEPMTEKLEAELLAEGVAPEKLVLDFFPGYQTI